MNFGPFVSATARAGALVIVTSAAGCYVESARQERAIPSGGSPTPPAVDDASVCQTTFSKGCFDGYIIENEEFTVDGRQFFNADELAAHFKELLTVDAKDYDFALVTQVDNQSFLQGFEYNLTGPAYQRGAVRNNGSFALDQLPEGSYNLRIHRAVKFTASHKVAHVAPTANPAAPATAPAAPTTTPPAPATPPTTTPTAPTATAAVPATPTDAAAFDTVTQTFCATIYSDNTLDVRRGTRLPPKTFTDFKLHVTDSECASTGDNTTISLRD